ncbi:type I restriction enzyme endonuclease domain-containing protein [Parashewanella curva]|nr:type I restriction enzyme endonuclease domain-containing protein [Parashewanella curva]
MMFVDLKDLHPIDFINSNEIGVDWHKKPSVQARLRNIVGRKLRRIQLPDDYISIAAESIVQKACELNEEIESNNSQ